MASSANKPSHIRFKEDFEKSSKKESGYFCKKYEDYKYCGCVFNGKIPSAFNFPNYDTDNENEFFKLATVFWSISNGNIFYKFLVACLR